MYTTSIQQETKIISWEIDEYNVIIILNLEGYMIIIPKTLLIDANIKTLDQDMFLLKFFFRVFLIVQLLLY